MARFAPVVPLAVASVLWDMNVLGNYHLLLAHDVLEHPMDYDSLYNRRLRKYSNVQDPRGPVVIMDNSVVELGGAMTFKSVLLAAQSVNADYLVCADAFLESAATIQRSRKYAEEALEARHLGEYVPKLMGVVQGRTIAECLSCADYFASNPQFEGIAIPRCLVPTLGSRTPLVIELYTRYGMRFQHWHLLGLSEDLLDDICTARLPMIDGIDSAAPIRGAMNGVVFDINGADFGPRGDFWKAGNTQAWNAEGLIRTNLALIRAQIA